MAQLPFSSEPAGVPDRDKRAKRAKGAERDKPMPVGALARLVKRVVGELPGDLRVVGEVSNLSARQHWFFRLKDDDAAIDCVMFASAARKVGFDVDHGMEVVATGRLDFYPPHGKLQMYVERLEPVGQGALELRFQKLAEELRGLGYFDVERKKALPAMPEAIAVVTSRSGAALQDVIDTARRRWPGCRLHLIDVRVQGEAAAPGIAEALRRLSADGARLGIEAVILTRGGGSLEDLWAFNEREVVEAVAACSLPTVAAIGHETDTTLAELAADVRCATPTQAAMTVVPDREALAQQAEQLETRLSLALRRQAALARQRLEAVARHALFSRPEQQVDRAATRLEGLAERLRRALPRRVEVPRRELDRLAGQLEHALPRRLLPERDRLQRLVSRLGLAPRRLVEQAGDRLDGLHHQLDLVGPRQVLERGYTLTTTADGKLLRSAADAEKEGTLVSRFADGTVSSRTGGGDAGLPALPPETERVVRRPRKRRGSRKADDGPGLFG
ncbi:MAG: exodeoxyribonuclease VII large subunit [Planctomycetota bacterium]